MFEDIKKAFEPTELVFDPVTDPDHPEFNINEQQDYRALNVHSVMGRSYILYAEDTAEKVAKEIEFWRLLWQDIRDFHQKEYDEFSKVIDHYSNASYIFDGDAIFNINSPHVKEVLLKKRPDVKFFPRRARDYLREHHSKTAAEMKEPVHIPEPVKPWWKVW